MRTEVFQFFNTPSGLAVRTSTQIHEDETLAWSFEDTGIIDNGVVQARAWGIVVRAAVTCIADQRGIAKCSPGVVLGIDHEDLVGNFSQEFGADLSGSAFCLRTNGLTNAPP